MAQIFTLILELDDASLAAFAESKHRVILAKPAGNALPNVAWLSLAPARRTTITWTETYGVYAAATPPGNGVAIDVLNRAARAGDGMLYPFEGPSFGTPVRCSHIPPRHYDVRNDARTTSTFGLEQSASVNGLTMCSPVNAAILPGGMRADFTAVASLYVWTDHGIGPGSIFPTVPPDAALIVFDPRQPVKLYRYAAESAFQEAVYL